MRRTAHIDSFDESVSGRVSRRYETVTADGGQSRCGCDWFTKKFNRTIRNLRCLAVLTGRAVQNASGFSGVLLGSILRSTIEIGAETERTRGAERGQLAESNVTVSVHRS